MNIYFYYIKYVLDEPATIISQKIHRKALKKITFSMPCDAFSLVASCQLMDLLATQCEFLLHWRKGLGNGEICQVLS
jgi:hypothetical protein